MAKIIRLTENDLTRIVKRVIEENRYVKHRDLDSWTDDETLMNTKLSDDDDWDEEEFDDYDTFSQKYPDSKSHRSGWSGQEPKSIFDMYKDKYGPLKVRTKRRRD